MDMRIHNEWRHIVDVPLRSPDELVETRQLIGVMAMLTACVLEESEHIRRLPECDDEQPPIVRFGAATEGNLPNHIVVQSMSDTYLKLRLSRRAYYRSAEGGTELMNWMLWSYREGIQHRLWLPIKDETLLIKPGDFAALQNEALYECIDLLGRFQEQEED